jgi:hypothetical protein
MTATSFPGPLSIEGQKPTFLGPTSSTGGQAAIVDSNPDLAPSLIHGGIGLRDPRWLQRIGAGALAAGGYPNQDVGWLQSSGGYVVCDQVPSTKSNTNIAAAQGATSGTALTLAGASTGITVLATPLSLFVPLGATIPTGALVLDGNPGYVGGGTSGAFQFLDPTKSLCRCVSVTANAGATGGVIAITGYDVYGALMHQNITAVAGLTVNSTKAFKFIVSAVPAFTDGGHTYSVGTTDIFGFNIATPGFPYTFIYWAGSLITTNTGFVAAVTTAATATSGDVRGTYNTQSGSNGTNSLQLFVGLSVTNAVAANFPAYISAVCGVSQF